MNAYNREMDMKEFSELVEDAKKDIDRYEWDKWPERYDELLETFPCETLLDVTDNDYQGSTRVLFKNIIDNRYGMLIYGWGSCSGCDAFQGCHDDAQCLLDLRNQLWNQTEWRDSAKDLLDYFNAHDWEGDWGWNDANGKIFIEKAKELLENL